MKKSKRIVSLVLTLAVMFSLFAGLYVPAAAAVSKPAQTRVTFITGHYPKNGKQEVRFRWAPVSNVKGYQIKYNLKYKSGGKFKKQKVEGQSYVDLQFKNYKDIAFKVRAYKMDGSKRVYGKWSKKVVVKEAKVKELLKTRKPWKQ